MTLPNFNKNQGNGLCELAAVKEGKDCGGGNLLW